MSFKNDERLKQVAWKMRTTALSEAARRPGRYTGPDGGDERQDFFLGDGCADENLHPAIRERALAFFRTAGISWHDGNSNGPSNYLMDSMVSCVNCLMPVATNGRALAALLRNVIPDAVDAVPLVGAHVLAFEWLGRANHLDETHPERGPGRFCTSADAFCVLTTTEGRRIGVVIEWKYTETYRAGEEKKNRRYDLFFTDESGPLRLVECGLDARSVRYEPFYQLARLATLGDRIERTREDGVDEVHLAWVVPAGNRQLRTTLTSPLLAERFKGRDVEAVFRSLLRRPERFHVVAPAALLAGFPDEAFPAEAGVMGEIRARYAGGR